MTDRMWRGVVAVRGCGLRRGLWLSARGHFTPKRTPTLCCVTLSTLIVSQSSDRVQRTHASKKPTIAAPHGSTLLPRRWIQHLVQLVAEHRLPTTAFRCLEVVRLPALTGGRCRCRWLLLAARPPSRPPCAACTQTVGVQHRPRSFCASSCRVCAPPSDPDRSSSLPLLRPPLLTLGRLKSSQTRFLVLLVPCTLHFFCRFLIARRCWGLT